MKTERRATGRVYLDHNATSPLLPEALEGMLPYLRDGSANASSLHRDGQRARLAVEEAREEVAALARVKPSEVVFTSGGTEANNAAILGVEFALRGSAAEALRSGPGRAGAFAGPGNRKPAPVLHADFVSTTIEHPAVHRTLRALEGRGWSVVRIAPDAGGVIDAAEVIGAVHPETRLVSVMQVNNEIGTLQPVDEIAESCRARGVAMHTDAVQALGRVALPAQADLISLSAHKIGGPQGVGALIVRAGARLEPLLRGGPQELRRRAGTENVAGIAGFGAAARLAAQRSGEYASRLGALRDGMERMLAARFPALVVHGAGRPRVANTSCFSVPGTAGAALQVALDLEGFSISTGTACASGKSAPSYVLRAMDVEESVAAAALRVSLGWATTAADVRAFVEALAAAVARGAGTEPTRAAHAPRMASVPSGDAS